MSSVSEVMYGKIGRLRDTYRYSAQPSIFRENVAEHSFWTAMIGITIAFEVNDKLADKVALKAVVHDLEECMTGDLVRDMKYANSDFRESVLQIEREFLGELLAPMGMTGKKIFTRWEGAKDNSLAGQIVGLADALSVISYTTREKRLGNTGLKPIRDACADLIHAKFVGSELLWPIANDAMRQTFREWPR